ncbi:Prefoldin subunit-domain-containing protein [Diplogelasinospora grovesii]|uniref:Prefoldin subunit-domain-containing protein n=1 Tax=Diplogelasinospora grovesii TaxID=303347 RepID=A0AAN6S9H8_9PEZI|nr:Prefoldin subunit-domain-containing protein [Diplogelasinospora grovesii]
MAQKDHLSDLGRHMQLLEDKVSKLHASLEHWQKWYLDYAALKEEVDSLAFAIVDTDADADADDDVTPSDAELQTQREGLARIRRDFDSDLLTKKEINEIFGKNDLKSHKQISSVLDRRLDYVEQNIKSLEKQVEAEENKIAAIAVVAQPDGGTDEESGLPITDIIEELDEEGNVTNFRLQTAGGDNQQRAELVEALRKVGLEDKDIKEGGQSAEQSTDAKAESLVPAAADVDMIDVDMKDADLSAEQLTAQSSEESPTPKKSVSFAEDTKTGHEEAEEPPMAEAAQRLERLMQAAREQEKMDLSSAVMPEGESAEDRELRRQMLEYSMSDIGPVVAELQLEEDDSGNDDWDDEEIYEDEEDEDEDEDELGRSKHSVITHDYIKRMQELEKRLGFNSAFTANPPKPKSPLPEEGIGRISVVGPSSSTTQDAPAPITSALKTTGPKEKKSVSFSKQLDIADEPAPPPPPAPKPRPKEAAVNPIGNVMERTTKTEAPQEPEAPKRVSRFKKERVSAPPASPALPAKSPNTLPLGPQHVPARFNDTPSEIPPAPTGPEGAIIANEVIERSVSSAPKEPDDMDDTLLYQAAKVEYNRLRNRMIQREGGFMKKEEETPIVPLDEEEGGPPRVSRFKAARLARS